MAVSYVLGALVSAARTAVMALGGRLTERWRARYQLSTRPLLSTDSAEGDHVRVTGVVRVLDDTLIAPLSGRTCVAYRARATVHTVRPGTYVLLPKPDSFVLVPFLIEGTDHVVLIDGDRAVFDLPLTKLTGSERQQRFMTLHGYTSQLGVGASFREVVVEPGMVVTVAGVLMRDVALAPTVDESTFRAGPPPTLRLSGNREHPLAIGLAPR
ncbi:MAG: hypothetical protein H0T42_17425 [Deltaproteobacteria bacterium]|nr:hypothetical protein [Deltaproteobacteria bacterium]